MAMESMQQDKETVSLKKIIIYYVRHWKTFVVTGIISLLLAIVYLVWVPRTYEIAAKILLLEDQGTSGSGLNIGDASGLLKTFGLGGISGSGLNLDNEMNKLQSTTTWRDVVIRLGMDVVYYKPGEFRYKMYNDAPLVLSYSESVRDALDHGIKLKVKIASDGKVTVKTKTEKSKHTFTYKSLPATIELEEGTFTLGYRGEAVKPYSMTIEALPPTWVAEEMSTTLKFDDYSKSADIVELSYQDYERQRALDMINVLTEIYNDNEDLLKKEERTKSINFLNDRLTTVTTELSDVEMRIEQYKLRNKLTNMEYDVQFYVENMKELQSRTIELEAQIRLVNLLEEYVKDPANRYNLVPVLLVSGIGEGMSSAVSAYNEALIERSKVMQSMKKDNPLNEQVNKSVDQLRESVYLSIRNTKKGLDLTLEDLKGKEKVLYGKMGTVPTLEREYVDYRRQQEITQALYLILLQKREDFALSIGEKKDRARLVEMPYVKKKPVAPRKLYALIGMVFFTLVMSVCYLFCKEQLAALIHEYKKEKV